MNQSITVTENCEFCGMPLPEGKAKGRKQNFHPACGQVSRSLTYAINKIAEMDLSPAARKRIRRQMFYVSNSFTQEADPLRDRSGRFLTIPTNSKEPCHA